MKKLYFVLIIIGLLIGIIYLSVNLVNTKTMSDKFKSSYLTTQGYLVDKSKELRVLQNNYDNLTANFNNLKTDFNNDLNNLKIKLENVQKNYDSITSTIKEKYYTYVLRDPSYDEMKAFLKSDTTDSNRYNSITYNCFNYSKDVINNAHKIGLRCGFVYVEFPDSAHACIAFNTSDKGIIYIEPQADEEVLISISHVYLVMSSRAHISPNNIVNNFAVIW